MQKFVYLIFFSALMFGLYNCTTGGRKSKIMGEHQEPTPESTRQLVLWSPPNAGYANKTTSIHLNMHETFKGLFPKFAGGFHQLETHNWKKLDAYLGSVKKYFGRQKPGTFTLGIDFNTEKDTLEKHKSAVKQALSKLPDFSQVVVGINQCNRNQKHLKQTTAIFSELKTMLLKKNISFMLLIGSHCKDASPKRLTWYDLLFLSGLKTSKNSKPHHSFAEALKGSLCLLKGDTTSSVNSTVHFYSNLPADTQIFSRIMGTPIKKSHGKKSTSPMEFSFYASACK